MQPLNSNTNQSGAVPYSSNGIIYQGPDIPCISLCKGDTVSDVIAKLAQDLCDLVDQAGIDNYDLTCFGPVCPHLDNQHDLIQYLIQSICTLNGVTPTTTDSGIGCPDCVVPIASCLYFPNSIGDIQTTMQLSDYVQLLGNNICTILGEIKNLDNRVTTLENEVATLILNSGSGKTDEQPNLPSVCVISPSPVDGVPVPTLVHQLEIAFCGLVASTGPSSGTGSISNAITAQCAGLSLSPSLAIPSTTMGTLPGWVNAPGTLADSVNNMWITICDLRSAVQFIKSNCCPSGCDGLVINYTAVYDGSSTITLYFTGTVPSGFVDGVGNTITITEGLNSITRTISIIPNVNGSVVTIPIAPLTGIGDFSLVLNRTSINNTTGATCSEVYPVQTIVNSTLCPTVTYVPTDSTIAFSFASSPAPVSYTIALYTPLDVLVDSQTITNPTPAGVTGTFTGLTDSTTYKARVTILVGTVSTDCPFTSNITTTTIAGGFWIWDNAGGDYYDSDGSDSRWIHNN